MYVLCALFWNSVCLIILRIFLRSKTPKVLSNFIDFLICRIFCVVHLNCVFLHLIHENYLLLCLRVCKCNYIDLRDFGGLKDNLFSFFVCWTTKLKRKERIVDQNQKETNIYWKKKKKKVRIQEKKKEFNTNFFCNFICGILIY